MDAFQDVVIVKKDLCDGHVEEGDCEVERSENYDEGNRL